MNQYEAYASHSSGALHSHYHARYTLHLHNVQMMPHSLNRDLTLSFCRILAQSTLGNDLAVDLSHDFLLQLSESCLVVSDQAHVYSSVEIRV